MNHNISKSKILIGTLIGELVIIALLFLPVIIGWGNGFGLTARLVENSTQDDAISGWLVFPALLGNLIGGLGYIIFIMIGVFYYLTIALSIGWNALFNLINKKDNIWLTAVAVLPGVLYSIQVSACVFSLFTEIRSMQILLYIIPCIILLGENVIQICMSVQNLRIEKNEIR